MGGADAPTGQALGVRILQAVLKNMSDVEIVTGYARATHRYMYSFFPAFRAPSFFTIIPIYTHIIPTAPSGLDRDEDPRKPKAW
jgi:hypothetical protein